MSMGTALLSVKDLFSEREARRKRDREAQERLDRQKEDELSAWKERLDAFDVTDQHKQVIVERIKAAFDRGETQIMFASFPSAFCSDGGRAVANADVPPLNPPTEEEQAKGLIEPAWLATLPKGARPVYEFWERELKPGGFKFTARIINFPGGKVGDVGLFFSWPKDVFDS